MEWYVYDIRQMTDGDFARWYGMMGEEKRRRVDRFRRTADKQRTVAADMLARRALSGRCGVPPEQIRFDLGERGKPYAIGLPLHFSLSHSGDLAVCAVDEAPVGIDVERIRPVNLKVARRIAAPEELCRLFGRSPEAEDLTRTEDGELLTRFFELWTAKEAVGKLTGAGLFSAPAPGAAVEYIRDFPGYLICVATQKRQ